MLEYIIGIVCVVLLIPYFGWGIYTLRIRYRHRDELPPVVEGITMLCLVVYYACQLMLLYTIMQHYPFMFLFSILGLLVSGAALYGPMLISLTSQLLVSMVIPGERTTLHEPRFGPAEALERIGDYEGALREYHIIARIFPHDAGTMIRMAETLIELDRTPEAVFWYERGLRCLTSAEKSLAVTNRLVDLYRRKFDRPEDAKRILAFYLIKYPNAAHAASVKQRLDSLNQETTGA